MITSNLFDFFPKITAIRTQHSIGESLSYNNIRVSLHSSERLMITGTYATHNVGHLTGARSTAIVPHPMPEQRLLTRWLNILGPAGYPLRVAHTCLWNSVGRGRYTSLSYLVSIRINTRDMRRISAHHVTVYSFIRELTKPSFLPAQFMPLVRLSHRHFKSVSCSLNFFCVSSPLASYNDHNSNSVLYAYAAGCSNVCNN
jgi:hypothetical protein